MKVFTLDICVSDSLHPETVETIDEIMNAYRENAEAELTGMGIKFVVHQSLQLDMLPEDEEEEGL